MKGVFGSLRGLSCTEVDDEEGRMIFAGAATGWSMAAFFGCGATRRLSPGVVFTRTSLPPAVPRSWCIHQELLMSKAHGRDTPSENEAPASRKELTRRIFEIVGRKFEIQKPAILSKVLFEEFLIAEPNGSSRHQTKSRSLSQASLAAALETEKDVEKRELLSLVLEWQKEKTIVRRGGFKASGETVMERSDWVSCLIPDDDDLPTDPSGGPLLLVDGNNIIFRSFYALPLLTAPDGRPVGALVGFCNIMNKLVLQPWAQGRGTNVRVVIAFDTRGESFRKSLYPGYKADRPPVPESLRPQFALVREACDAYGFEVASHDGFEADDVIATLTLKAITSGTTNVTIVSTDKDLAQLVTRRVKTLDCYTEKMLGPEEVIQGGRLAESLIGARWSTEVMGEKVLDKYLAPPGRLADLLALAGDKADGIKGAEGYGPVKAAKVLAKHATLEGAMDEISGSLRGKNEDAATIERMRSEVMKARSVTGLRTDVPIDMESKSPFQLGLGAGSVPLLQFMRNLGMNDLARRTSLLVHKGG